MKFFVTALSNTGPEAGATALSFRNPRIVTKTVLLGLSFELRELLELRAVRAVVAYAGFEG